MKISIDISQIIYDTGVSLYTKSLVQALLKIDPLNKYLLFGGSLRRKSELEAFVKPYLNERVTSKLIPIPPLALSFLWNRLHKVPVETFIGKVDVFHSSDWTQPPTGAYKVTTIHDLAPLRFPEISHPNIVSAHKHRLEWVKREVDKVIAVSEATKSEIIDLLGISENKIIVIPEAGSNLVRPSNEKIKLTKNEFGLDKYLLVVGADPRKNVENIIHAYKKVKLNNKSLQLVIIGTAWKALPKVDGVVELGHISRAKLNYLYSGAEALVYASTYEGFGLPILEAMTLGCPVVTSNISSMPEVAGKAAELVNPYDVDSIAEGITRVLTDRLKYVAQGIKQARRFSWEETAKKTLEVYKGAE